MFKVKAVLIDFLGDEEKYPCHFQHKIGDEVVFDGERYTGRLCPAVWPFLVPKVDALWAAGPRHIPADYYFPFWYAPVSIKDPSKKVYDGLGFANVFKNHVEDKMSMANLKPLHAYEWPPYSKRTVAKDLVVICPDTRTSALFRLEAFDLSDKGLSIPYFRRQMAILDKVQAKPGISADKILKEFSKKDIEIIYPALSPEIMVPLIEELESLGYLKIVNNRATVTRKGETKLKKFKASLTPKEKKALNM